MPLHSPELLLCRSTRRDSERCRGRAAEAGLLPLLQLLLVEKAQVDGGRDEVNFTSL